MNSSPPKRDVFDWLVNHPREGLQLALLVLIACWQVPAALIGSLLFFVLYRVLGVTWWKILITGASTAFLSLLMVEIQHRFRLSLGEFIPQSIEANKRFFKLIFTEGLGAGFYYVYQATLPYILGFSPLVAGLLSALDQIKNHPHEKAFHALKQGKTLFHDPKKDLDKALSGLPSVSPDGVVLGVSMSTGQPVILPDQAVNQLVLTLGTTGGGKTITLRRFYDRAISKGYPLIIIDGKPTDKSVNWVMERAAKSGRSFYGFNCGPYSYYDPLAYGGYTELKDKIISLKDEWQSEYYRTIAEDYLQTAFQVLLKTPCDLNLSTVSACLDYNELALRVRALDDKTLIERVRRLENYDKKDITGLQAHLNLLIHSEFGDFLKKTEDQANAFNLVSAIKQNAVVYFALPALRYPNFSSVLAKLVTNDIKTAIDRISETLIYLTFDEFQRFAGVQVLNLANMGREKGLHTNFGTQGLADLASVSPVFCRQLLNCINTIICHRLNDQESAELVSKWIGTRSFFDVTAVIGDEPSAVNSGSVSQNKAFIVHPDEIKQELQIGEAFFATKVGKFHQDKIKIKYS